MQHVFAYLQAAFAACGCVIAGSTQQHWPFPGHGQEETGYAYIMTHPGMPTVMWEHYFDYGLGGCIKHLIDVRYVVPCTLCDAAATVTVERRDHACHHSRLCKSAFTGWVVSL